MSGHVLAPKTAPLYPERAIVSRVYFRGTPPLEKYSTHQLENKMASWQSWQRHPKARSDDLHTNTHMCKQDSNELILPVWFAVWDRDTSSCGVELMDHMIRKSSSNPSSVHKHAGQFAFGERVQTLHCDAQEAVVAVNEDHVLGCPRALAK